jgi:hypothetical protein
METTKTQQAQPPGVFLTFEQIKELMVEAVKAAKAPSEAEQKKLDEQAAIEKRRLAESIELANIEIENREKAWASCSHRKPNGVPSRGGQIHSDGLLHIFCLICQFPFPPTKPLPENMANGLG